MLYACADGRAATPRAVPDRHASRAGSPRPTSNVLERETFEHDMLLPRARQSSTRRCDGVDEQPPPAAGRNWLLVGVVRHRRGLRSRRRFATSRRTASGSSWAGLAAGRGRMKMASLGGRPRCRSFLGACEPESRLACGSPRCSGLLPRARLSDSLPEVPSQRELRVSSQRPLGDDLVDRVVGGRMETVVERPAALDVHKEQVTACVRVPAAGGNGREQHVARVRDDGRGAVDAA